MLTGLTSGFHKAALHLTTTEIEIVDLGGVKIVERSAALAGLQKFKLPARHVTLA